MDVLVILLAVQIVALVWLIWRGTRLEGQVENIIQKTATNYHIASAVQAQNFGLLTNLKSHNDVVRELASLLPNLSETSQAKLEEVLAELERIDCQNATLKAQISESIERAKADVA